MSLKTVGILSPGHMGHTVGKVLGFRGLRVIACLQGRSERTRSLAAQAQIQEVPNFAALVREAEMILSILVPAEAMQAARVVAQTISETQSDIIYADCNAIAPQTCREIGQIITASGGRFVDAGIIGPPPVKEGLTRFYASGPHTAEFQELGRYGLEVIVAGEEAGQASAVKMCYAALTKGLTALCAELLTAAQVLGVSEILSSEFVRSQGALYERMEGQLPSMPMRSRRWVGEMEEVAKTFASLGLTPKIHSGAADIYRFVGATRLAEQKPEDSDPLPTLSEFVSEMADHLRGNIIDH